MNHSVFAASILVPKMSRRAGARRGNAMMFRSYNTTSEYFLSDYVAIAMAILRLVTTT